MKKSKRLLSIAAIFTCAVLLSGCEVKFSTKSSSDENASATKQEKINTVTGDWTCTGSKGTLKINIDDNNKSVLMSLGTFSIDAKYEASGEVTPSKKKDGYKYTQYIFTSGSNSTGATYSSANKVGFIFGLNDSDVKKGHYVDTKSATALEFDCTRN